MSAVTLKSLHTYLLLLENSSELKRRLPNTSNPRTLQEGLSEMSRLIGVDETSFKEAQTLASLIGAPRFVMIGGEPSVTEHVARVFESSRVLLTGFGSAGAPDKASGGSAGALAPGWAPSPSSTSAEQSETRGEREVELTDLKPLLTGQLALTCRLFRALFEHMLGFMAVTSVSQGSAALVGELTGGRDQSRSFLSTAMFILGKEVDGEHLMAFMAQQGLFSMAVFEHMLQNRDYCDAFHTFRHLERAFVGTAVAEEAQLRTRLDQFHAPFGGKPCATRVFAADEEDKAQIDAHLAAADLLEALALTPWGFSLHRAVSVDSAYSFQSVVSIARHFERFAHGEATKDQANRQISDHLLAFARQFSADGPSA